MAGSKAYQFGSAMRTIILLSGLCLVGAVNNVDNVKCSINAARAVDEMLDAALFIWASTERCGSSAKFNNGANAWKCEMDVSSSAESVNAMANVIVHALKDCGGIESNECGMSAGRFTQAAAGLAAAAGGIVETCRNTTAAVPNMFPANSANSQHRPAGKWAYCLVDVKDSLRSLMKATQRILHTEKACKDNAKDCASTATSIVAAFAALGQYATSAVGHCAPTGAAGVVPQATSNILACSSHISQTVRHTAALASAAVGMSKFCEEDHTRLYELDMKQAKDASKKNDNSASVPLIMLLPFTAVLGFAGGLRLGSKRQDSTSFVELTPMIDAESNLEIE